ncbi:MAG: hydrogenase maturation protease [Ktedonobacteraceae bacterium]
MNELTDTARSHTPADNGPRILVAGVGNVLHGDDAYGVIVVQRLALRSDLPSTVKVVEVGIGGISLVQDLFDGYDVLMIVDAVEREGAPGTIFLLEPQVPDLAQWPHEQRQDFLANMHMTTPSRALILARALGVLPPSVYILGCQPTTYEELVIGLSPPVERAVELSVERLIGELTKLTNASARDKLSQTP